VSEFLCTVHGAVLCCTCMMLCSLYLWSFGVVRGVVGFVSFCGSDDFVLCVAVFGGKGFYSIVVVIFVVVVDVIIIIVVVVLVVVGVVNIFVVVDVLVVVVGLVIVVSFFIFVVVIFVWCRALCGAPVAECKDYFGGCEGDRKRVMWYYTPFGLPEGGGLTIMED
jgi:hypothetical protein